MAKLTSKQRGNLASSSFAVPSKAPGSGSYPIPDASHARNALARAAGKPVQGQVDTAVHRKFPAIDKGESPRERAAEKRNPSLEKRESPARQRAEGETPSGMDRAMSAQADKLHPAGKR